MTFYTRTTDLSVNVIYIRSKFLSFSNIEVSTKDIFFLLLHMFSTENIYKVSDPNLMKCFIGNPSAKRPFHFSSITCNSFHLPNLWILRCKTTDKCKQLPPSMAFQGCNATGFEMRRVAVCNSGWHPSISGH